MAGAPKAQPRAANTIGKRGKFRLAAACAALMSDEEIALWLREVMAGRDPDADPSKPSVLTTAPSWSDRIKAAALFLERRNGKAPTSIVVENEQAAQTASGGAVIARAVVTVLPAEDKATLRALLGKAAGRSPAVIDTMANSEALIPAGDTPDTPGDTDV